LRGPIPRTAPTCCVAAPGPAAGVSRQPPRPRCVFRHFAVEAESTKPAVSEVQVNLFAKPTFRANAVAVANQQHPDEQFGINRRPASSKMAPSGSERLTNRQNGRWTLACESPERVVQVRTRRTALPDQAAADPSSLPASRLRDRMNQRTPCASTGEFFNTIGAKRPFMPNGISCP